ncbi:MAG: hypothetical protein WC521_00075 [Bdellovibrionales bacterium]|jgi:hypothetical protein
MPALSSIRTESIVQEFESIDAYLQAVHEILQEGHMPDVVDLDDRIAHLCSNVEGAPLDIQETCLIKLGELLQKLNDCETHMTALHTTTVRSAQK